MKKISNAVTLFCLSFCALQAKAEGLTPTTSVTLYGVVDTAVRYTSHSDAKGNALWQMTGGTFQGSRFGLRGNEDLGGGAAAYFVLENGFSPDTGALGYGGRLFGRQAIVGLNGKLGVIQLGRDTTLGFDTLAIYDSVTPMNNNTLLQMPTILVGDRLDNSVKYRYQAGPVALALQYGAGESAGNIGAGRSLGASVVYTLGAYSLATVAQQMKDGNQVESRVLSVGAAYQGNSGKYAIGFVRRTTGANFNWQPGGSNVGIAGSSENILNANTTGSRRDDLVTASMNFSLTPQWVVYSGYMVDRVRNVLANQNGTRHTLFGIVDYLLSKRTDIYLEADFNKSAGALVTQPLFGNGIGNNQSTMLGVSLGVRHKF
ncbi:MAG: porin [Pseudomonadota bacterium]